jgi:uncharacterized protein YbjQ (UPF0145 family)
MPEKITNIGQITFSAVVVIGIIWTAITIIGGFILKWFYETIKSVNREISHAKELGNNAVISIKEKIKEIGDTLIHYREMHEDHYDRIRDVEQILNVCKTQLDDLREEHKIHHRKN